VRPRSPARSKPSRTDLTDPVSPRRAAHVDVDPNLLNPGPAASTSTPSQSTFGGAGAGAAPPRKRKHLLTSTTDPLFAELRDKNFAVVGNVLNRTARRLNDDYEKRHQAKTPAELRQFVGQLGGLQSEHQALRLRASPVPPTRAVELLLEHDARLLTPHGLDARRHEPDGADHGAHGHGRVQHGPRGAAECVLSLLSASSPRRGGPAHEPLPSRTDLVAGVDLATQENSIRDLINQEAPLKTVLRLLCLYSIVSGGIKQKTLEEFKRDVLQVRRLSVLLASLSSCCTAER